MYIGLRLVKQKLLGQSTLEHPGYMTLPPAFIALQLRLYQTGAAFLQRVHIWHTVMQGNVSFCHGFVMTPAHHTVLALTSASIQAQPQQWAVSRH